MIDIDQARDVVISFFPSIPPQSSYIRRNPDFTRLRNPACSWDTALELIYAGVLMPIFFLFFFPPPPLQGGFCHDLQLLALRMYGAGDRDESMALGIIP